MIARLLLCLALFSAAPAAALEVPRLTSPVVDTASLLSATQRRQLEEQLQRYHRESGNQLQVLSITSLQGESIEQYSIKVAETWKIGNRGGTGVILLVARDERQLRVEVGDGLEGKLTDVQAGRIIDETIVPRFRDGDYYGGITAGLSAIADALGGGEGIVQPAVRDGGKSGVSVLRFLFFTLVLLLFFIASVFGRRRRGSLARDLLLGAMLGGGFRRGGWHGGGIGGSWSGGGGGFSGGGASGRW